MKQADAASHWIWGAFKMPGRILHELKSLWLERNCEDEFIGTLVNAYISRGGKAIGVKAGRSYVDVGTFNGYRSAMGLLRRKNAYRLTSRGRSKATQPRSVPAVAAPPLPAIKDREGL